MKSISFSPPDITEDEIKAVTEVLRSGWITTGPRTKKLEHALAERIGTPRAVCLNSATAAMELTLRILGIGPDDEVIVPAYTYTATASVVQHVGAKLIMIDTASDSFEIDYTRIAAAITERTKMIIPVDLGGKLCDYTAIYAAVEAKKSLFCPKNSLQEAYGRIIVMADSSHGLGANCAGKESGRFADFTCFSFHAVKNMTTAEGGAVTWNAISGIDDRWLYQQYMLFSLHGQSRDALEKNQPGDWMYDILFPAYKCNMTDVAAAMGLSQLSRYDKMVARRHEIIRRYDAALNARGILSLKHVDGESISSGHLYLARIPGFDEDARNQLIIRLAQSGIATNVHYRPLPMLTAYRNLGFSIADYPNAFAQYQNEITLPLHTKLSDEDVAYVTQLFLEKL